MSIATLGIYDNPTIRPATEHLWQAWRTLFINFDIVTAEQSAVILDHYATVPETLKQQLAHRFSEAA